MINPMIDGQINTMTVTSSMTYPITDPVTDPMTDVLINSITGHMTNLTKIVLRGQFRTVVMSNIISREENMFGDRASERHSVVIYL